MTRLTMPQLGESVTEGTIIKWLKQTGDRVAVDEPLVEIETEKVNVEVPSPWEGTLTEILVPEGETVSVGTDLAAITQTDELTVAASAPAVTATSAASAAPLPIPQPEADALDVMGSLAAESGAAAANGKRQRYSPAVLRLAEEHNLDLAAIPGSGLEGRVTRKDVLGWLQRQEGSAAPQPLTAAEQPAQQAIQESVASPAQSNRPPLVQEAPVTSPPVPALQEPPAPAAVTAPSLGFLETAAATAAPVQREEIAQVADEEIVRPSPTRRAIAQHMVRSVQTSPHAWMVVEIDMTRLVRLRESLKASFRQREGVDLTYLAFMLKATVLALKENPRLNASWRDGDVVLKRRINLGIAVDTDDGLMAPVIHNADNYSIAGLARVAADLAVRARSRRLRLEDVQGGTFTVDNTGVFGSIVSAPIINQPQAAIVTMEAIIKRPVVVDDGIAVRSLMNSCISFDHRIVDGGDVGRFMKALKLHLEGFGEGTAIY